MPRSPKAALDHLQHLLETGEYEQAEAEARALAARPQPAWRRRPILVWQAAATAAAVAHGRGAEVLAELETLIAELEETAGAERALLLMARNNRVVVLVDQGRHGEAEAEALEILRAVTRLAHLTEVWKIDLIGRERTGALPGSVTPRQHSPPARAMPSALWSPAASPTHLAQVRTRGGVFGRRRHPETTRR